ncbi:MAG TPA: PQQ-binding-like beta-propeller repeat protein [Planctomycetota bacterium]
MIALLLALSGVEGILALQDWGGFRGPGGRGIAEGELPLKWSKADGVRWKADLPGRGLSCPVVAGGRVYVSACDGPDQERLLTLCFDAASGRELWRRELRATGSTQCNRKTCMAAATPAADGRRVAVLFATGDLAAFDPEGRLLWYRSLVGDYPTIGNNVGMAASPVLSGDRLFVAMENVGESFALALDVRGGANLWKHARAAKINWTTPFVMGTDVLFQSGEELTAYDAATGALRWSLAGKFSTIPSPTAADGLVFAPGGTSVALRPEGKSPSPLWESKVLSSATATPTIRQGRIYTINSGGIVVCGDVATGEALWKQRIPGAYSASPVIAGDRLYAVNEAGLTTVLKLGAEPSVLAENALEDVILASPAAAAGTLYFRSDKALYAVGR